MLDRHDEGVWCVVSCTDSLPSMGAFGARLRAHVNETFGLIPLSDGTWREQETERAASF